MVDVRKGKSLGPCVRDEREEVKRNGRERREEEKDQEKSMSKK